MAKNNLSILVGRVVKDASYKKTANSAVSNFTLAVERDKRPDADSVSDFIPCVFWGKSAEKCAGLKKGDMVSVMGAIQTRKYEGKSGTVYVTEVNGERIFLDTVKPSAAAAEQSNDIFGSDDGFTPIDDDDSPF